MEQKNNYQYKVCRECKQRIRRPIDHFNCLGATDDWFLDTIVIEDTMVEQKDQKDNQLD